MKLIVHDYAGHPFQVQLSRELAARGHDVLHLYCTSTHTPQAELRRRENDPPFDIRGISLSQRIPKTNFVKRLWLEMQYGPALLAECERFQPEVVISANTPSIPQVRLARWCGRNKVRLVSWIQDIYGLATYRLLKHKLPVVGHAVGQYFISLDRESARRSDAIVVIADDFGDVLAKWGIDRRRIYTIHNWAPLEDMPMRPRDNDWSRRQKKLTNGVRFVYSGTLAMKHNPALLLELARMLNRTSSGELIVVSEGAGVEWLTEHAAHEGLGSLRCLGFQPFEELPDVLGSADVLVAILEADAGVFSVPSKVLSYLCAGRPVLLAVPKENLAAKIIVECGAGPVVEPADIRSFCAEAQYLIDSPRLREQFGRAARRYADMHFDIRQIGDRFEAILCGAAKDHIMPHQMD